MTTKKRNNIEVTGTKVHSDRVPTQAESAAGVEYVNDTQLKEDDLIDARIENPVLRVSLGKNEGNISITVLPGEHLGELSINVQFEGKSGEHEICLKEQDTLLQEAADWLNEILSDFGCDFKEIG